ncbi:polysaccharide deacetylase family protein [Actinomadura sp. LD22]|uniref:Polysaccharide deacetylase family protein n=1 Tax=Actinomadura physcomitrii TaxID=2650748 RepID=A0A6I4MRI4_9ACTN|nr:polysaccharide deacetylase family protein [Actinomadura physcomitrii]MWA06427.1 polysaccharide deacetylase family protein [Actinomadura physcomitrii]
MNDTGEDRRPARPGRRNIIRGLGLAAGGLLAGGAGFATEQAWRREDPPTPASAASVDSWQPPDRQVDVVWAVHTRRRLVALTFDDGPMERWTPQALDALDEAKVPATFFMVGSRLARNARLVAGRLGRHEVGNHTWKHDDLSRMSFAHAYRSIHRTHQTIEQVTGRAPALLRPPWGRLGGTTLHVAAQHGYELVLWSLLVQDRALGRRPDEMVAAVVDNVRPGTIVLAHDVGAASRRTAIERLPEMIRGLRGRGFDFVTVSQLRRAAL